MKAKDTITVKIESFDMEGKGVAHADGYTFFVSDALPGEEMKVAIDRVKGSVVFAHIIKMLAPSPLRRDPECPLFGKCGGCALRHIPYSEQIEIKRSNVRALFHKNADIEIGEIPFFESAEDGYRNKIALPFGSDRGEAILGMYRRATHKVLALDRCPLHGEWIEPLIRTVLAFVREEKLSVYDESSAKGLLRHLVARRLPVDRGYEYSVILVANGTKIPHEDRLADRLSKAISGKVNVYLCKNTQHNNVILTPELRTIRGDDHIRAELLGSVWEVSPLSFLQVNFPIAERIYEEVTAAIPNGAFVIDAYSGTGIMSALLARRASKVVGIEVIRDATVNAEKNAISFGVEDRVTHLCGKVEDILPDVVREGQDYSLVLDPPRAGLDPLVIDTILDRPPERILYVSCSPMTLTRDVARLKERYDIESVKLFDMFPNTPHVETLCLLRKK